MTQFPLPGLPTDTQGIPVPSVYVPGVYWVPMAGSPTSNMDNSTTPPTEYTPMAFDLQQIGDQPVSMAGSDGVTPNLVLQIAPALFNGISMDMQRGNIDGITVLSASQVSTDQESGILTNFNHRGCIIVLTTTNIGTGSITLSIEGIEPVSDATWTILTGAAVTTDTTNVYRVHPNLPAVTNATAQDILPRSWKIKITANNANPADYAVYGMLCL